jgi:hypothetical protein
MTYVDKLRKHRKNIGLVIGASVWNNPSPRDTDAAADAAEGNGAGDGAEDAAEGAAGGDSD